MKKIEDICVIVQGRLSSERCPGKMIRPFAGSNLLDKCLRLLMKSEVLPKENIFLSVHEPELQQIGTDLGINVFPRSEVSALWDGGEGAHIRDMYEWWDKLPFKYVVLINACTPMIKPETIDGFLEHYMNSDSDGLFGVVEKQNYFWNQSGKMISIWPESEAAMNTKAVEATYEAAHCLYAGRMDLIGDGIWMGDFQKEGDIELYPMSEEEIYDIDHEWQFGLVEAIFMHTYPKYYLETSKYDDWSDDVV